MPCVRRLLAYLVLGPVVLLGELAAHQLGYRIAANGHVHEHLAETGHAYLHEAGGLIGVLFAVMSIAVMADALCLSRRTEPPLWRLAALAPATFLTQETLEAWSVDAASVGDRYVDPAFLAGMTLQVPIALVCLMLASLVCRSAREAVAGVLAIGQVRPPGETAWPSHLGPVADRVRRPRVSDCGVGVRGPPVAPVGLT